MKIIAFDPFSTEEKASEIGAKLVKDLDDILANADIITVHVPKNEKTLNMINTESIGKMKAGAFLINCARGGIVNEEDLANAVKNGKLKGAAVDVYTSEPTTDSPVFSVDGIIHTPHLGASTSEAQERVAMDVVKQLIEYFESDKIVNAVNIAGAKIDSSIEELAHKIGIMCGQLSDKLTQRIVISYKENIKGDHEEAVTRAVLNGYLSQFNEGINYINAMMIADEKGIDVVRQMETRRGKPGDLGVSLNGKLEISGGVVGKVTRLTGIDEYTLDIPLNGNFLIIKNADVPGVIGHIGTVLGEYSVNIANMEVGRSATGGQAVTVIGVDQEISAEVIEKLKSQESIIDVKTIKVGQ